MYTNNLPRLLFLACTHRPRAKTEMCLKAGHRVLIEITHPLFSLYQEMMHEMGVTDQRSADAACIQNDLSCFSFIFAQRVIASSKTAQIVFDVPPTHTHGQNITETVPTLASTLEGIYSVTLGTPVARADVLKHFRSRCSPSSDVGPADLAEFDDAEAAEAAAVARSKWGSALFAFAISFTGYDGNHAISSVNQLILKQCALCLFPADWHAAALAPARAGPIKTSATTTFSAAVAQIKQTSLPVNLGEWGAFLKEDIVHQQFSTAAGTARLDAKRAAIAAKFKRRVAESKQRMKAVQALRAEADILAAHKKKKEGPSVVESERIERARALKAEYDRAQYQKKKQNQKQVPTCTACGNTFTSDKGLRQHTKKYCKSRE